MERLRQVRITEAMYVATKELQVGLLSEGVEMKAPDVLDKLVRFSVKSIEGLSFKEKWKLLTGEELTKDKEK